MKNTYISPNLKIDRFDFSDRLITTSGAGMISVDSEGYLLKDVNSSEVKENIEVFSEILW